MEGSSHVVTGRIYPSVFCHLVFSVEGTRSDTRGQSWWSQVYRTGPRNRDDSHLDLRRAPGLRVVELKGVRSLRR